MITPTVERKVHLYHDQKGATIKYSGKKFANTLCKMNSDVPASHITTDPSKVTCKICRRDHRFAALIRKRNINEMYGKMAMPTDSSVLYTQMFGRALRPGRVNGMRTRYRLNWRGKLILQVEEQVPVNYDPNDLNDTRTFSMIPHTGRWRDATMADLDIGVV